MFGQIRRAVNSGLPAGWVGALACLEGFLFAAVGFSALLLLARGGPVPSSDPGAAWWAVSKVCWAAAFMALGVGIRRLHPVEISPFAHPGIFSSVAFCWITAAATLLETWSLLYHQYSALLAVVTTVAILLNVGVFAICTSMVVAARQRKRHVEEIRRLAAVGEAKQADSALRSELAESRA